MYLWMRRLYRAKKIRCLDVLENQEPNTDSILINESLSEEIKRSLSTLTEREREIIVLFFGLGTNHPLSLEEIGEKFNLTREACTPDKG
jgi:RNA polymerase primary sigma factor